MSEPCPPGYTRIKGVCVKNPTPDPPTIAPEESEDVQDDQAES